MIPYRRNIALRPLIAFTFLTATVAQAAVVAEYRFTGGSVASADNDTASAASAFSFSGGNLGTDLGPSGFSNSGYFRSNFTTNSQAGAITANDYFSFTIDPGSSPSLQLTTLAFNFGGSNDNNGTFTTNIFLRTSLNGYSSNVDGTRTHIIPNTNVGGAAPSYGAFSLDLSSLPAVTTSTTFRLYVYDSVDDNPRVNRIDDVVLSANAVPEPGNFAAMGGLLVSGMFLRFRRGKRAVAAN